MVIKEKPEEVSDKPTFADLTDYMLSLAELHNLLEDSNAPQKYALQVKICDEIDAILDHLSLRK